MNYELFEDSDAINPIFIASFERPAEFRPRIGDELTLPNDLRIFKVNRSDPTNNPDDQKVLYFVRETRRNIFTQAAIMVQDNPRI